MTPRFNRYQARVTTNNNADFGHRVDSDCDVGSELRRRRYSVEPHELYRLGQLGTARAGRLERIRHWFREILPILRELRDDSVLGNSLKDSRGRSWVSDSRIWRVLLLQERPQPLRERRAFMASRGFNYMRILSEVPERATSVTGTAEASTPRASRCQHGVAATGCRTTTSIQRMLDVAYDKYGCLLRLPSRRAGDSFPTYSGREAHCQRILNLIAGRERKVAFLEVANEGWQTGFDYRKA